MGVGDPELPAVLNLRVLVLLEELGIVYGKFHGAAVQRNHSRGVFVSGLLKVVQNLLLDLEVAPVPALVLVALLEQVRAPPPCLKIRDAGQIGLACLNLLNIPFIIVSDHPSDEVVLGTVLVGLPGRDPGC